MSFASTQDLLHWIQANPRLSQIFALILGKKTQDAAHDASHLLRVALWGLRLLEYSSETTSEELVAAALLHDWINLPKDHPDRLLASQYSADAAKSLLLDFGYSSEATLRICEAIRDHSYSRGQRPESHLGKALQDADRLEAIGSIGLMRVFATGAKMNTAFFDAEDPWARKRDLNDRRYSIDHFFQKLLKIHETMNTEAGKLEAQQRPKILREFLIQLGSELGEPYETSRS